LNSTEVHFRKIGLRISLRLIINGIDADIRRKFVTLGIWIGVCRRTMSRQQYINLFPCTPNTRESPSPVWALWSILRDRKESVQNLRWRHRAQEPTACLQSEAMAGRVPIMHFRGIRLASKSLVRYRNAGWIGHLWLTGRFRDDVE